jgi:hypothetical protein
LFPIVFKVGLAASFAPREGDIENVKSQERWRLSSSKTRQVVVKVGFEKPELVEAFSDPVDVGPASETESQRIDSENPSRSPGLIP